MAGCVERECGVTVRKGYIPLYEVPTEEGIFAS